jgi:hypothetical protein
MNQVHDAASRAKTNPSYVITIQPFNASTHAGFSSAAHRNPRIFKAFQTFSK